MSFASVFQRIINSTEKYYNQENRKYFLRIALISSLIIFVVESLLMLILEAWINIPEPLVWYIDGVFLVTTLFPLNYYLIIKPMMKQIDERRKANEKLLTTNEILERFFSGTDVMVAYLDRDMNFIRVNNAYANSDGHEPDFYIGKNHFALFPNSENQKIFENVVKTGKPYRALEKPFEYVNNMERGTSYWDWDLMPVKDNNDQITGLILVLNDVTARKLAQLDLADSELKLKEVFNQSQSHMMLLHLNGKVKLVNNTVLNCFHVNEEDVVDKRIWELPWWNCSQAERTSLESQVMSVITGTVFHKDLLAKNRGDLTLDVVIKPMLDESGQPIFLIYEARDISTRVRKGEEIKKLYQAEYSARQVAETLYNATTSLAGILNTTTVLEKLLDLLQEEIPYSSAHIDMLEDSDHLKVRIVRGEEEWPEEKKMLGLTYDCRESPVLRKLMKDGKEIVSNGTIPVPTKNYFPGNQYVQSMVTIPLSAGNNIIGICNLEHVQLNFFSPEMIQIAAALTKQASISIQNAWLFEQLQKSRERMQALSRKLVQVQEMERLQIARELHDEAGQGLASLMMGLRSLERERENPSIVKDLSYELRQMTDGILQNLHRLAVGLRPATLDHLGLVPAIRQYLESVCGQNKLAMDFDVIGKIDQMPEDVETAIFRIVQEALTNVVRHAQASRIDVLVENRHDALMVIVEDDGVGIKTNENQVSNGASSHHLGLIGMQERAEMMGAKLSFERSSCGGTSVILEVPWQFES